MANVAFIGLGNMGGPMAVNLVKAGHSVSVFDLSEQAIQVVVSEGANKANSAQESVKDADFIVSMLPAGKHVKALYLGQDGLSEYIKTGALVIDSSTIDASSAKEVAQGLSEKGIDFIDAPVSGGVAGAAAGTLSFMVGGSSDSFERAKTVLNVMGKTFFMQESMEQAR